MAAPLPFEPRRFRTAARHYLTGRPPYSPRLIRRVAELTSLPIDARVLDLGCGPGILAAAFAPFVAEVLAVDPEPEMLRIARETFGDVGNIRFLQGSSYDLSPEFGRFQLVTMGRSFHWMDRPETLRRLDSMIQPGGAVALFDSEHRNVPDNRWHAPYSALVRQYGEDDPINPLRRGGTWVRHEAILLDSAFCVLENIGVVERRRVTIAQLIDRAFSRSSTAPERLGSATEKLASEIDALLREFAPVGELTEVVETSALIGFRDEVAA